MKEDMTIIEHAVRLLQSGELVAFPTETVYGLGADASNPAAVARLYAAKGRPTNHPVIVHLADSNQLSKWASSVPFEAIQLAEKFWPGPLTLILPKADHVLDEITGGQKSVGLRVPAHPLALELLKAFGGGIIAPSANKFGRLSPTRAEDVRAEFKDEVSLVLDGGPCAVGIESTIVDLSREQPMILRPGMIDQARIEAVIGKVLFAHKQAEPSSVTRAPGDLASHYAPSTPLKLVSAEDLQQIVSGKAEDLNRTAVLSLSVAPGCCNWIVAETDPEIFARDLYQNLRQLDGLKLDRILVETPPVDPHWEGIWDRLRRASAKL
ncbi:MAG: threonylcarbamoyl-AMP synthase [Candidatus Melainabacteria bacterium]|nr:MAG: threonylcarbamoyl-AMP synthase [Candidatus Melainabacteria bacterium]